MDGCKCNAGRNGGRSEARTPDPVITYHFDFRRPVGFVVWTMSSPYAFAFRRVPFSLYTFRIAAAWLGVVVTMTWTSSPNLTPVHCAVSSTGSHRESPALPTELIAHFFISQNRTGTKSSSDFVDTVLTRKITPTPLIFRTHLSVCYL